MNKKNKTKYVSLILLTIFVGFNFINPSTYQKFESSAENNIIDELDFEDATKFNDKRISKEDIKSQSQDLFIQNDEIVDVLDSSFSNIYIFDSAQVTLTNVTVSGDIEIYGTSTLLMQDGGSMNRLFLYEESTVTLDNINNINEKITGNGNSTLIIVDCEYLGWFDSNFNDGTQVQISNSYLGGYCHFYYFTEAIIYNSSFSDLYFSGFSYGDIQYSSGNYLSFSSSNFGRIENTFIYNSLSFSSSSNGIINHVQAESCSIHSQASVFCDNSNFTNQLFVGSESLFTINNNRCGELYLGDEMYDYSSSMEAYNLTVYGQINLRGDVSVVFDSCDLQGSISSYRYDWEEIAPSITLKSSDATITKESSGYSDYNNTADYIYAENSEVVLIFISVDVLELCQSSSVTTIASSYNIYNNLDGTGSIQEGGTILINNNYFIGDSDVLSLSNNNYQNVYLFDNAQVTLTNVTVSGDIEIYGTSTLLMQDGGSMNRLFLYEFSTVTLDNINNINEKITGNGNSTLIIVDCEYLGWFDSNFNDGTQVQISNSYLGGYCHFYDFTEAIIYNSNFSDLYFSGFSYGDIQYSSGNYLSFSSSNFGRIENTFIYNSLSFSSSSNGIIDHVQAESCSIHSQASVFCDNSNFTNQLFVGSESLFTINNSRCGELYFGDEMYDYSSSMEAYNLTVYGQINLRGDVSVVFDSCDLQGSISSYRYDWEEIAPTITLKSSDATITKESSGYSDYNNTADEINLYNSEVTLIFIFVTTLNAYDNSRIHNQNAEIENLYLDSTSTLVGDDMDFDGLSDDVENQVYFTDPENPDSDGDGYGDGEEIKYGGDPMNLTVFPADIENPSLQIFGIETQTTYNKEISFNVSTIDNRGIDYLIVWLNETQVYFQEVPTTEYWLNGNISEIILLNTKNFTDGNYDLIIQSYDIHTKMSEDVYEIIIDNSPVSVNLVGPYAISNNSRIGSGIMLEFEFSETPQIVYYSWDSAPNSTILQYVPVGDGMHYLDIYTSDAIGNWLKTSFAFEIDDSCVLIYLTSPSNSSYINSGTPIEFNFSDIPTNLTYSWDSEENQTAALEINIVLNDLPSTQGEHILEIWTNSSMGNWNYEKFLFIVDDFAPNIYLMSPANNSTNESGLEISIDFSEELSEFYYAWDGGENFTTTPILPAGDGTHYLDVYAFDFVPNYNHTRFYFITDDPLIVTLISPNEGSTLLSNVTIDLNVLGTEGDYIYNWDNKINYTVSINEDPMTPILDGEHILYVFAEDALGNKLTLSFSFTIENPEIEIILVSPENHATLKNETQVVIEFSETPVEVYYIWDGGENSTILSLIPGIEGNHQLEVYALNIHGKWSYTTFEWNVDFNDIPTVDLIYPTGGETISGQFTISWEGFDADNDPLTYSIY